MTTTILERRGLARLAVLSLPAAAVILLPAGAMAAGSGSTIRATVGGDGAVKSVKVYAPNGSASSFNGTLPLKLGISRTVSGSTSTYTYHVENTYSKTQTVTYTDTAGKTHSASADLQLPLVAQLGIQLPSTFTNVSAPNGVVETDPDGVNRLLFNLVLFSPIGSPSQDVTFTATGKGAPTAELSAKTVDPNTTSGLSSSAQDANASSQQDDFWTSYASGGNGGLTQLADGVGKMIAGLTSLAPGAHKLADGLKAAGDGANKLDAGTKQAFDGSKQLATGTVAAHSGAGKLSSGLGLIAGGLAALDSRDPKNPGLPAAKAGLDQLLVGLVGVGGTPTSPKIIPKAATGANNDSLSILLGIDGHAPTTNFATDPGGLLFGLNAVQSGLAPLAGGLDCANVVLKDILQGTGGAPGNGRAGQADVCYAAIGGHVPPMVGDADATAQALLGAMTSAANPNGIPAAAAGVHFLTDAPSAGNPKGGVIGQLIFGVSHTPGTLSGSLPATDPNYDKGGLLQIMESVATGVTQLDSGVTAAVNGIDQLAPGAAQAYSGSKDLNSGLGKIATGTGSLSSGLGQLSAGQHQVATGLPAAVSGAGQIADGADQLLAGATAVKGGILAVQSGATAPLTTQLTQASQNAKKQVAILTAAGALASEAPGGAGATYVLSQSPHGFRLAASTSSSGGSHTGRNVGIGLGGLVVLVIAVTAGFMIGRRSTISA